jgi:hypothetical protein
MKTHVIGLFILLALACHKEDLVQEKPSGTLKLKIGLYISITQEDQHLKSTSGTENFKVVIYTAAGQAVRTYDRAADMPDEIRLETGSYYVTASSDNDLPAAFNNPWYFGKSDNFTVTPGGTQSIVVTCELANSVVTVQFSDNIRNLFATYQATVSSAEGSLLFGKNENRAGYFRPLPLTIQADLSWLKQDGTTENKTLTGTIADPKPRKKYEIHIEASAIEGMSMIVVSLGDTAVPVEIVNISDGQGSTGGTVQPGDLLITEIMYDPTAITDTYGEWIEVYNNTNHSINLKNMVLTKSTTDRHVISADVIMPPHGYQVLARAQNATPVNMYIYGTSVTLNNTGAELALSTYGTNGSDGIKICSVDYSGADFPSASGASLSLDPAHLNATDAGNGIFWCAAKTVFGSGDLGTPGTVNDNCNP